jgi:hypothetical protein
MKFVLAVLSALALLALGSTAQAQTGTPAWSIRPLILQEGPGTAYDVTGEIAGETRIYVDRCSKAWCRVHKGSAAGWTSLYDISFDHHARGPLTGPRLNYKSGGPGTVCLYEGPNFTGASLCRTSGFVAKDLLLLHLDNRFSSVSVEGDVSVILCRDRELKSYCERINESEAHLHGFLDNNVTSVRIY